MSELERWESRYREHNVPWNTNKPSTELAKRIEAGLIPVGSALEVGCGFGTDAIYLAELGFKVTAVDISPLAIEEARRRSTERGVSVDFRVADLLTEPDFGGPFDFLFDRGVYHIVRSVNLEAFLRLLEKASRPGTLYLSLSGNANETREGEGPPKVTEAQIREEFGSLFDVLDLQEFRWEESEQLKTHPLGWAAFLRRKVE